VRDALTSPDLDFNDPAVCDLLRSKGAERCPHGPGTNLYDHLIKTASILRAWNQPAWLQNAGALHSIYATDVYKMQLIPLAERDRIRALTDTNTERLAYLFCTLDRADFWRQVNLNQAPPSSGLIVKSHRAGHEETVTLSQEETWSMIVLYMANEAEQVKDSSGGPGIWLAHVSQMGTRLLDGYHPLPPVFDSCRRPVSPAAEKDCLNAYNLGLQTLSVDLKASQQYFENASQSCPWVAEPVILTACIAAWTGDPDRCRIRAGHALDLLSQWGTAWDKKLSFSEWRDLTRSLAGNLADRSSSAPGPQDAADPHRFLRSLLPESGRLRQYLESFTTNHDRPRMPIYPGLSARPWYDAAAFPFARALEANYEQIRDEVLGLDRSLFHHESEAIKREGAWKVVLLYELGRKNSENTARCPVTTRLVEAHSTVRTIAGLIYFSRMAPGTHIKAHWGPTNLRLRCHLGIQIPAGDCAIRVGGETRGWEQGKCIVFDDFNEHEAWNRTAEDRIVLIADIWHPDLTPREISMIEGLHRYAFQYANDLSFYWSENAKAQAEARKDFD
jgi:aspartate beta-hydroxylase